VLQTIDRFGSPWLPIAVLAVVGLTGCGGNGRPKTIPVTGRMTIDGQEPGEFGKLFFTPTRSAEGYSARPASGSFNTDGTYSVMSWAPNDGLVPGHYTVRIVPADAAKTKIAKKYLQGAADGLEVDVPVDEDEVEYNIDIKTK
jgi:hypothetical protein